MKLNEKLVEEMGGKEDVARFLGIQKQSVYMWFYDKPKGCGGKIPAKHAIALARLAKEKGIDCTIEDLIGE